MTARARPMHVLTADDPQVGIWFNVARNAAALASKVFASITADIREAEAAGDAARVAELKLVLEACQDVVRESVE